MALLFSASASIFAIRTDGSEAKSVATFSQTGARVLQSEFVLDADTYVDVESGKTHGRTMAQ